MIPESGNITAAVVAELLSHYRFGFHHEKDLQQGLSLALTAEKIKHEREVYLGVAGRLDFLCVGGLAIEVKLAANKKPAALLRQLEKYAAHERVTEILVVTSGVLTDMPSRIHGKIVLYHLLLGSCF